MIISEFSSSGLKAQIYRQNPTIRISEASMLKKEQNIEILGGDGSWEEKIVCTANQKKFLLNKGVFVTKINKHHTPKSMSNS